MNCVELVSGLDPRLGGISDSIPQYCNALAATGGCAPTLVDFSADAREHARPKGLRVPLYRAPAIRFPWSASSALSPIVEELIRGADVVHMHGLWLGHLAVAARLCNKASIPYIVSAHGMLQAWSRRQKRIKKSLYFSIFEQARLRDASCLRALTEAEVGDYRSADLKTPVVVYPNGVNAPPMQGGTEFRSLYPELADKRIVLFLGRLHPKKGLHLLLEAWSRLAPHYKDTQLVLAGSGEPRYERQLRGFIRGHGLDKRVTLTGFLANSSKWHALAAARLFVLPSLSEGLSVSVLEALAAGVPVVITTACNLPEVSRYACGWEIGPDVESVYRGLGGALSCHDSVIAQFGENAKRLVGDRFSWQHVSELALEVYNWVWRGTRPPTVEVQ